MRILALILILLPLSVTSSSAAGDHSVPLQTDSWKYLHPAVFDWRFYLSHNSLVCDNLVDTEREAAEHWMVFGIGEGRRAHPDFSVTDYIALNPSVAGACGGDHYCAVRHLVDTGLAQGLTRASSSLAAPAGECVAARGRWSDLYGIKGITHDSPTADFTPTMNTLVGNGAGNLVINVSWPEHEDLQRPVPCGPYEQPANGIFFNEYDGFCYRDQPTVDFLVREYSARGVRPVVVLHRVPAWARGQRNCSPPHVDEEFCVPDDLTAWGRFAGYIAWRYDGTNGQGRTDDFVIHNEVNTNGYFNTACDRPGYPSCESPQGIDDRAVQYAASYNHAYDRIVAHNASAKLFYSFTHEFDRKFDSDGDSHISVKTMTEKLAPLVAPREWRIAYHPYWRDGITPATPDDLPWVTFGNIGALVGWLEQAFPFVTWEHEVFLTESGFSTFADPFQPGHDPSQWATLLSLQASELCRSYETVLGTPGITNYSYHRFQDQPDETVEIPGQSPLPINVGLITTNDANGSYIAKPSWTIWAIANRIDVNHLICGFDNLPHTILKRGSHPVRGHWATSRHLPPGFTLERSWKLLYTEAPHTQPLYECAVGPTGSGHNLLSLWPSCEGLVPMGPVGYIYTTHIPGSVQLFRCNVGGDHIVSEDPGCEGGIHELELGWAFVKN